MEIPILALKVVPIGHRLRTDIRYELTILLKEEGEKQEVKVSPGSLVCYPDAHQLMGNLVQKY